jgi:hypothetical protein
MEEWIIIILLVIFVIMFLTLKPEETILFNKPQTQTVQCHKENEKDLVMLPKPNPVSLVSTR